MNTVEAITSAERKQINWSEKVSELGGSHRDKTRVQMTAKIFPHLKVKC